MNLLRKLAGNRIVFLAILIATMTAVMSGLSPYFLTVDNLLGMTRFGATMALLAMGQALIVLAGGAGIDISMGSILSLSGVLFGLLVWKCGLDVWTASACGVVIGGLLGSVNGLTVAVWDFPPMIGTFATMWAYAALALIITGGVPVSGFPESFAFLGQRTVAGIPAQIALAVMPVYIILQFVMSKTAFGRSVYLIGINQEAARFAGLSVTRIRFFLYCLSGLLAGMGGVIMASWLMAARPDIGVGLEMQALTVTVLGGIDIFGGSGSLAGVMLAVLVVIMMQSGMQLANINTVWQLAVLGVILLGAVALNQALSRKTSN
ncbi:MAG: ABC transporter permease [Planctomycetota bacterium]|jgi:ribose/xylose/arabinose/galactoside ABC-type transport system permease subunit|nr:ABC transporter permease [Planctomycetota bacterium]